VVEPSGYLVVAWDLDTTGRRLIDEICHIGGFYVDGEGEAKNFSQYVMPYKNPNPGARRSFGIRYFFEFWGGFIKSKHRVKERFDTCLKKLSMK
jgi:hypothetical protein